METCPVYSFCNFKGMYSIYMYIYKLQKFLVLFSCLNFMALEVNTLNIKYFWIPR